MEFGFRIIWRIMEISEGVRFSILVPRVSPFFWSAELLWGRYYRFSALCIFVAFPRAVKTTRLSGRNLCFRDDNGIFVNMVLLMWVRIRQRIKSNVFLVTRKVFLNLAFLTGVDGWPDVNQAAKNTLVLTSLSKGRKIVSKTKSPQIRRIPHWSWGLTRCKSSYKKHAGSEKKIERLTPSFDQLLQSRALIALPNKKS